MFYNFRYVILTYVSRTPLFFLNLVFFCFCFLIFLNIIHRFYSNCVHLVKIWKCSTLTFLSFTGSAIYTVTSKQSFFQLYCFVRVSKLAFQLYRYIYVMPFFPKLFCLALLLGAIYSSSVLRILFNIDIENVNERKKSAIKHTT